MKKLLTAKIILLGLISLSLYSCTSQSRKVSNALTSWDSTSYTKKVLVGEDSDNLYLYTINSKLTYPTNDTILYNKVLKKMYGDRYDKKYEKLSAKDINEYFNQGKEYFSGEEAHEVSNQDSLLAINLNPSHIFIYDYENKLIYEDDELVSMHYCYYSYQGGAHGLEHHSYLVYDKKKQDIITEEDLFNDLDRGDFDQLFLKVFEEQLKKDFEDYNIEDIQNWASAESIKPNGNFYLTEDSIIYHFNPYEVGPYAIGTPKLKIPYSMVKDFLKEDSPIKRILEKNK